MPLNAEDKSKIRYHLGYLASGFPATMQFGSARPYQTVFLLEAAMESLVEPHAVNRVKRTISILDTIEEKMICALDNLAVEQVDTVKIRGDHTEALETEYKRWTSRLADQLGAPKYGFSQRNQRSGPGSSLKVRS